MNALKVRGLMLLFLSSVSIFGPGTLSADPKNKSQGPRSEEILRDPHFENGFAVSPLWPAIVQNNGGFEKTNTDTIRFRKKECVPDWQMAQWASKYDLGGTLPEKGKHGTIIYRNEGKEIARSSDGTLLLDITTSTEYDRPRTSTDAWPHLLIQQDFVNRPNIGQIERLDFSMELRIVHCENRMKESEFDKNLHTAQSPFYFFMRNENPESPDYQLALWVGIPSFDYRYLRLDSTERVHWDIGTATYIYAIPPRTVWGDISFHDHQWHKAQIDLLPLILRSLEAMQEKGVFTHTVPKDLVLTGMNFGWEVPGTFDAGLKVRNMSIRIVKSQED